MIIRSFGKTVKTFFSDKIACKETIKLAVNDAILSDDQVVTDTFNNYFYDIVKIILTKNYENFTKNKTNGFNLNLLDPVELAILKCKNHPS